MKATNIFIAYDYTSTIIIFYPIPNTEASTINNTFQSICNMLEKKHQKPQCCVVDVEAWNIIIEFLLHEYLLAIFSIQRTKSEYWGRNNSKFFKNHVISGLCSMFNRPKFPYTTLGPTLTSSWRHPQNAQNCMQWPIQNSISNPPWEHNSNAQPWEPCGCKAILYKHLQSLTPWGPGGTDAWYTRLAKDHYKCYMYISWTSKSIESAKASHYYQGLAPFQRSYSETSIGNFLFISWSCS